MQKARNHITRQKATSEDAARKGQEISKFQKASVVGQEAIKFQKARKSAPESNQKAYKAPRFSQSCTFSEVCIKLTH